MEMVQGKGLLMVAAMIDDSTLLARTALANRHFSFTHDWSTQMVLLASSSSPLRTLSLPYRVPGADDLDSEGPSGSG
jgi:hypothetical protein